MEFVPGAVGEEHDVGDVSFSIIVHRIHVRTVIRFPLAPAGEGKEFFFSTQLIDKIIW